MKHVKLFEELKKINSKDLKDWSIKDWSIRELTKNYINTPVTTNTKFGIMVEDLLKKYNISVEFSGGDFLNRYGCILPAEKNYKEYRVELFKIVSEKDILDEFNVNDISEIENDEDKEEAKSRINEKQDFNNNVSFSVFLSTSISTYDLKYAALVWASKYLKKIYDSFPDIINCKFYIKDPLIKEIKNFKTFLKFHDILINNDNLDILLNVNYRIYKDSKFFVALGNEINNTKAKKLFTEWLALINKHLK